jgi:hypothetical protein
MVKPNIIDTTKRRFQEIFAPWEARNNTILQVECDAILTCVGVRVCTDSRVWMDCRDSKLLTGQPVTGDYPHL